MIAALNTAVGGIGAASKRFGAASTAIVAVSAYQAAGAASVTRAVQPAGDAQGGDFGGGLENQGGRLPLPDGLVALLQDAGVPEARGRFGSLPTLEDSTVDSILAQRAFEANLRSFQTADRMLGATLDLVA